MHHYGRIVRRLAWACALLALVIASLSASIRLVRTGAGCEPWPACAQQRSLQGPEGLAALDPPALAGARVAHRTVASVALLLVIALAVVTLSQRPPRRHQAGLALALLAVAIGLAILGRMGGASRAPPVVVANLLGGYAMVAISWRLVRLANAAPGRTSPGWALAALLVLAVQVVLGALASATQQAGRCVADGPCQVHAGFAIAVAAVVLPVAWLAWRRGARMAGAVLVLLLLGQGLAGAWLLQAGPASLPLVLAHNLGGALLLAAVAGLLPGRTSSRRSAA